MTAADPPPPIPELSFSRRVASTNFSEVWQGEWQGCPVAIKLARGEAGREMLETEAQLAQRLELPGVMPALTHGDEPVPYLVTPWMEGGTLRERLDVIRDERSRSAAMAALLQVVTIVKRLNAHRIAHCDLKPENILFDVDDLPRLTDLGLARHKRQRRLEDSLSGSMTTTHGRWGGTLAYMPPEGLHGAEPDVSWDVYALGVMLHEVLVGRPPNRGESSDHLLTLLPEQLVAVLRKALAAHPADRYPDAGALERALLPLRRELLAQGWERRLLRSRRALRLALAAFFIGLRYLAVLTILPGYLASFLLLYLEGNPFEIVIIGFFLLCVIIVMHVVIRWEGPETIEEANHRLSPYERNGGVLR